MENSALDGCSEPSADTACAMTQTPNTEDHGRACKFIVKAFKITAKRNFSDPG
jgi:hypothetical protein